MLASNIGPRFQNVRECSFGRQEPSEDSEDVEPQGFDTFGNIDNCESPQDLPITSDRPVNVYVLRDNYTRESYAFIGYCPDIVNREDQIMLPKEFTIYCCEFIPKGYMGGYDPETSISTKPREELVEWLEKLWLKHSYFDRDELDFLAEKLLRSQKPEITPLRRRIVQFERFPTSAEVKADFTYNYAKILSKGADSIALKIFSNAYSLLNKFNLDPGEFSVGFSDMVFQGASNEELRIYSYAAITLRLKGESLNDTDDYYGGLNNRCVAYLTHEKRKGLEKLNRLCLDVIERADQRYAEIERAETLNEDLCETFCAIGAN